MLHEFHVTLDQWSEGSTLVHIWCTRCFPMFNLNFQCCVLVNIPCALQQHWSYFKHCIDFELCCGGFVLQFRSCDWGSDIQDTVPCLLFRTGECLTPIPFTSSHVLELLIYIWIGVVKGVTITSHHKVQPDYHFNKGLDNVRLRTAHLRFKCYEVQVELSVWFQIQACPCPCMHVQTQTISNVIWYASPFFVCRLMIVSPKSSSSPQLTYAR